MLALRLRAGTGTAATAQLMLESEQAGDESTGATASLRLGDRPEHYGYYDVWLQT